MAQQVPTESLDGPSQSIGKKACGTVWVPYNSPCPGDVVYKPTPSLDVEWGIKRDHPNDPTCQEYPAITLKEDKDTGRAVAGVPPKDFQDRNSPYINIGRSYGLDWGCGQATLDSFVRRFHEGDRCAFGMWWDCTAPWNPSHHRHWPSGKLLSPLPQPPLGQRLASLYGLQEELGLPAEMRATDADCSERYLARYEQLQTFHKDEAFRAHMSVVCVSEGLGNRLEITPQIRQEKCDSKYDKGKLCATVEFAGDGEKVRIQELMASHDDGWGIRFAAGRLLGCDVRLARKLAAAPDAPEFRLLTQSDVRKLRHRCLFTADFYASAAVKAFYRGIATEFEALASRFPAK